MDFSRRVVLAANSDEHRSFCDPQQNDAIASARAASTALSTISTTSKTSSIDSINTHKTGTKSVVCVAKCLSFSPDRRSFAAATRWCRANWTRSSSTSSELVYRSALMRRCAQTTRAAGRRLRLALLRLPPSDSDAAWLRFASMSSVAHRRRRCERAAASTHAHRRDRRSIAARILDCSLRLLRARSQLTTSLSFVVLRVAESVTRLHSFARYRLVRRSFDLIRRYDLLLPRSSSVERCSVTAARLLGNDRCQSARAGVDVVLTRRHRRPTVAL